MNPTKYLHRTRTSRPSLLVFVASLFASTLLAAVGGCQERSPSLTKSALTVLDSMRAAREAQFDVAGPTLGFDREQCLLIRAADSLGVDVATRILKETADVDARHSTAERKAVNSKLVGVHEEPTARSCLLTDSLWYALLARRNLQRP